MEEAAYYQDYRTVWVKGREFARTGLGPKRRVYAPPDGDPPGTHDLVHMNGTSTCHNSLLQVESLNQIRSLHIITCGLLRTHV